MEVRNQFAVHTHVAGTLGVENAPDEECNFGATMMIRRDINQTKLLNNDEERLSRRSLVRRPHQV